MKLFKFILPIFLMFGMFSCTNTPNNVTVNVPQNVQGFDVQNFANLLKTTKDPQTLEQSINASGNTINNMDLDKDGNVDYLRVSEQSPGNIQVIDDVSNSNSVVVATLNISSQNNVANVQIQGNPSYCGSDYSYHNTFADLLLLHYVLASHSYYHSMYHYGYHPSYYASRRIVTVSRTPRVTQNNTPPASYNRSSLSTPSTSQRSFQVRTTNTPTTTKFGSNSSSGFGSSRSSFGGSRSSFGGRKK
jgi:hypothetical protein